MQKSPAGNGRARFLVGLPAVFSTLTALYSIVAEKNRIARKNDVNAGIIAEHVIFDAEWRCMLTVWS